MSQSDLTIILPVAPEIIQMEGAGFPSDIWYKSFTLEKARDLLFSSRAFFSRIR